MKETINSNDLKVVSKTSSHNHHHHHHHHHHHEEKSKFKKYLPWILCGVETLAIIVLAIMLIVK